MAKESAGESAESTARWAGGIVGALNREWRELERGHRGTAIRWASQHPALAGRESLDDIVQAALRDSDAVLAALLVEVASRRDQLAARVVLQTLIGRMVRMALRDAWAGVDDYISALWCRIQTYPLGRRPTRIAANLSLDTLQLVSGERRRLRLGQVTPWPPETFRQFGDSSRRSADSAPYVDDRDLADRILRRGRLLDLIDDPTLALLTGVYLEGLTGEAAARRHHTSAGTIRVRCSRALTHLAAHADQLVGA